MRRFVIKKINSIWFGSRILVAAGVFILVIPFLLYLLDLLMIGNDALWQMMKVSLAIGILILLIFSIILFIELRQDKRINKMYNKVKYRKMNISKGVYECQYCGNQKVQENDLHCKVCGIKFI